MTDAISADEKTTIITFAYISSILLFSLFFRLMYLNLIKFENRSGFLSICIITVKLSRKKQEYSLSIFISAFSTTERTLRLLDISILQSLIPIFEIRETADAFQSPAEIPTVMHSLLKSL